MMRINESAFVETENVRQTRELFRKIQSRKVGEVCGLALAWGPPGLGKTRCLSMFGLQEEYAYMRLHESQTFKDFLKDLLSVLEYKYNLKINPNQTANNLYLEVKRILNMNPTNIIIDEVDYAFKRVKIANAIRDLVDEAPFTNIILVGMADAKRELQKLNAHFFDRCNQFYEFKPASIDECVLIAKALAPQLQLNSDPEKHEMLLRKTVETAKGVPRKVASIVEALIFKANQKRR